MCKSLIVAGTIAIVAFACNQKSNPDLATNEPAKEVYQLLGYESEIAYGEHLVVVGGCDDCHSPKVMTDAGPEPDMSMRLSGHHADFGYAEVDRKMMQSKGYVTTNAHFTAWVGPWGVSFAGNLTSDATGIGNWTEDNFKRALREGKFKGLENGRTILPPMPWQQLRHYSDYEISAIFAYLKSTNPIKNVVPPPLPPQE